MEGWDLMKKCLALTVFLVLMIVLYGCSNEEQAASQETVTLQLGHALSPGTPASDNIDELAQVIEEKTEGRVKFEIYGNGQLGSETEMLEQMQIGSMQAGAIMVGAMPHRELRMAIEDLAYVTKSAHHRRQAHQGE